MSLIKKTPEYVVYKMCKLLDQNVAVLDPLALDKHFSSVFSSMSETGKMRELIGFITEHVHSLGYEQVLSLTETEAMAATRDIAMFASTFVRWDIQVGEVPVVEHLLDGLSQKTREVPADTVFSYGPRNPQGDRRRKFTTTKEEELFITSFSNGMQELPVCLAGLEYLKGVSVFDPIYPLVVSEIENSFSNMVHEILVVRKSVSPKVFTHQLRPFFEPKTIKGKKYFAPGGSQMPVTVIDLMLWGIEVDSPTYIRYWNDNIQYLPNAMRSRVGVAIGGSSIVNILEGEVANASSRTARQSAIASINALVSLMESIERFRCPHLGIAKANMKIRVKGAVGSGGYDPTILEYLLKNTQEAKQRLVAVRSRIAHGTTG